MKENFKLFTNGVSVNGIWAWVHSLSERTLMLLAISILHFAFVPNLIAYVNVVTDKLPNLDSFILILGALFIMMLRSIIKKDMVVVLIHSIGFVTQCALLAFILLK